MRTLTTIFVTLFMLTVQGSFAQMQTAEKQQDEDQKTMMQTGMMGGGPMMQNMQGNKMCPMCGWMMNKKMPMKRYMMLVNHLPDMQDQLSLTENQSEKLIDMRAEFRKINADLEADLQKQQLKMESMLNDDPSVEQVKTQMQSCADIKIDMKAKAYETAVEMQAVLTGQQKEELKKSQLMMQSGRMQGMKNQ